MTDTAAIAEMDATAFLKGVSWIMGWSYFLCWGISFYPQIIVNYKRKSTQGLTIDFPLINLVGFTCYTISQSAFLWSPVVREQYALRHPDAPETTVRFNDWAFGAHALVLCTIIFTQFWPELWGFQNAGRQKPSRFAVGVVCAGFIAIVLSIFTVFINPNGSWEWLDVVYTFGYVKLLCSFVKYTPQAYLNYKNKSTTGWNIDQILLDFAGGILSMLQLLIDSSLQSDWSGLTGNPVKLGLANSSLFFDLIFMTQHYVLYRHNSRPRRDSNERFSETDGLLSHEN